MLPNQQHNMHVYVKPSRWIILLFLLCWFFAGIAVLLLPIVWWLQCMLLLSCVFYGIHVFRKQVLLVSNASIITVSLAANQWKLMTRRGDSIAVALSAKSVITRMCMVLRFCNKSGNRDYSVVMLRDSISQQQFEQLLFRAYGKFIS